MGGKYFQFHYVSYNSHTICGSKSIIPITPCSIHCLLFFTNWCRSDWTKFR